MMMRNFQYVAVYPNMKPKEFADRFMSVLPALWNLGTMEYGNDVIVTFEVKSEQIAPEYALPSLDLLARASHMSCNHIKIKDRNSS